MLERKALRALNLGDVSRAVHYLELLSKHDARNISGRLLLGACRHKLGQRETAIEAFSQALAIDSGQTQAHLAIATILSELGHHEEALRHCQAALLTTPTDPHAHTCAAIVLESLGRLQEALQHYDLALRHDPNWADALKNRGSLLLLLNCSAESLENNLHFSRIFPQRHDAWFNLGESYMACHSFAEAAIAYRKSSSLDPSHGRALLQEAYALCRLEQFNEAQFLLIDAWQRFSELMQNDQRRIIPNAPLGQKPLAAQTIFLLEHFERLGHCDWRDYTYFINRFSDILAETTCPDDFPLGFRALVTGIPMHLQLCLAKRIANSFSTAQQTHSTSYPPARSSLRIAYLSPDFRDHAVSHMMHKLFALHNRSNFSVYAYAIGPDSNDPLRQEIKNTADRFTDLSTLSDKEAAARIADDRIDILIDLAGYTDYARPGILTRRPAALNISWLGYPASTGGAWMDYVVLDPSVAPPDMDEQCSEAIIRLPHSLFFCSYANEQLQITNRKEAGLPEKCTVVAAFHNAFKIDPNVFSIWMRLLASSPTAVLWLLSGTPEMEKNLRIEATARGINPNRLIFAPRVPHRQHLARFALADMLLDTPQCNGGTTICDAVVAGVPVLTCRGSTISQCMGTSLLNAAGFTQGITFTIADYETQATEWLSTPSRLPALRKEFQSARAQAPFFQLDEWVTHFESALLSAWQRYRNQLPPISLTITP